MTSTLADLQRRNLAQMENSQAENSQAENSQAENAGMEAAPIPAETSVLTDARTPVSTDVSQEAREDASPPVRKSARAEASQSARKEARQEERAGEFIKVVDAALASREPLLGGVKATVDMSPALSTRAKRYLADHRGQNTRQVLIALFDAFLSAKGY